MNDGPQQAKANVRMGKPGRPAKGSGTEQFRLEGISHTFDPRVDAIRADLADVELASRHFAPHYAQAVMRSCIAPRASILARPDAGAEMINELLYGEGFALLDVTGDWAWGYTEHDHYVGYLRADALGPHSVPTHRLIVPAQLVDADGKELDLPVGARVTSGQLPDDVITPLDTIAADPVATAEAMFGSPYLWGGRSNEGVDCSGLIQTMLARAGIKAPRDSDQQLAGLKGDVVADEPYRRGDIIYFPDHVGVMIDDTSLLHATRFYGKVVKEPLADVIARVESEGHTPAMIGRKRLLP